MKKYFFILFIFTFQQVVAQQANTEIRWLEDPLCKPMIWKELAINPVNNELWCVYIGKKKEEMTIKDHNLMDRWKKELMLALITDDPQCKQCCFGGRTDTDDIFIDDEAFKEIMRQIEEAKKNMKDRQKKIDKK
jgi:hypothetical protein